MIILSEKDIQKIQKMVLNKKMEELFEEPCTYEDEDDCDRLDNIY